MFVSFSLDPMLSAYWPDPHVPENKKFFVTKLLDRFNVWFNSFANGALRGNVWGKCGVLA